MQSATALNSQTSGYLATSNYLGYLIGAIIPIWFIFKSKAIDLKIYLLINIASNSINGSIEPLCCMVGLTFNRRYY
ncbi:major facilitator superfamily permease [Staphylococcus gallinarum]|uniref:Major facilitator superfamily permease n=1 Tax=Staphylococcus gallinarum TaxID=1293 RepID=A0A380FKJ1_STAGA|nr:major facilitator superfamily permease [Staphylococcus gallinarum]